MAKTRMVNTRFWNDGFISQLDPIEKLVFIYFITNEHTNICGIYELPLKIAAIETGIDPSMFDKILPRLKEKILYIDGWVCVKNFPKHQSGDNPKVKIGVEREMSLIPSHIIKKAIAYGYPMVYPSHSDSDLDSDLQVAVPEVTTTLNQEDSEDLKWVPEDGEGNEITPRWKKKPPQPVTSSENMLKLLKWSEDRRGESFVYPNKQLKAFSDMKVAGITAERAKTRWQEMELDQFWVSRGFDWMNVANSFEKKP